MAHGTLCSSFFPSLISAGCLSPEEEPCWYRSRVILDHLCSVHPLIRATKSSLSKNKTEEKHLILSSSVFSVLEYLRVRRGLNWMWLVYLTDEPRFRLPNVSPVCFEPAQTSCIHAIFGKRFPPSTAHFTKNLEVFTGLTSQHSAQSHPIRPLFAACQIWAPPTSCPFCSLPPGRVSPLLIPHVILKAFLLRMCLVIPRKAETSPF